VAAPVQLVKIGDDAEAERALDALESAIGLVGQRNQSGRRYAFAGEESVSEAADQLAAALGRVAPGWQQHLSFDL
jgi:hypothetical protein